MKQKILWILGGIALYLIFVVWRFPYQNLKSYITQQLQKNARITLVAGRVSPALLGWPGISFQDVDANVPLGRSDSLNIKAEYVTARVGIAGFFPFGPSISAYASGLEKGGELFIKFRDRKTAYGVSMDAADVDLTQFASGGAPVQGKLYSDMDITYDSKQLDNSEGSIDLSIDGIITPAHNIPGYLSTPELKLGKLVAKITVNDGVAKFEDLRFGGGKSDLTGSITGEVRLGKTYQDSTLNIVVKVQAGDAFAKNPESSSLLSYLSQYKCKNTPNAYKLKWNKAIGTMMRNTFDAFPQKTPC